MLVGSAPVGDDVGAYAESLRRRQEVATTARSRVSTQAPASRRLYLARTPEIPVIRPSCRAQNPRDRPTAVLPRDARLYVVDADAEAWEEFERLAAARGLGVAAYSSLHDLFGGYRPAGAACLVLDAGLLARAGLALGRLRGELSDEIPVILVAGHGDVASAVAAVRAGAADYLLKPVDQGRLWCEIQQLLAQDARERKQRSRRIALAARMERLTPREQQVLEGITAGLSNKRIAAAMAVSPRTVEAHRAHLMRKLEVHSLVELLRLTMRLEVG